MTGIEQQMESVLGTIISLHPIADKKLQPDGYVSFTSATISFSIYPIALTKLA